MQRISPICGKIQGHLTGKEAGKLASEAGVGRLVLTHLPQYGDRAVLVTEAESTYSGPIELAYTKQQIEL
ncbi:hypothetical protein [Chryseomicrobium excrementi]|uniref:MBL fold metallo-hydrolase n=1 Tax=Chryseomicrobium excrementi TaxID=2041346 RepID=UPI0031845D6F